MTPAPIARLDEPIPFPGARINGSGRQDAAPLAVLQSQIERLLDGDEAGVYGIDRNGHATLVTPAVAAMTGHTVDDLVGRSMHEVLHHSHANGDCYPREDCPIYAAFRDGKVHRAQEVFWRKDGSSFPIEYTSTPLIHAGILVGAVVVFRDLGRRREVHDRIRDMMAQIEPARPAPRPAAALEPVGKSEAWLRVMDMVRRVAPTDTTVLLLGESGTGKEPVARAIHDRSPRRGKPLVKLNCAAIPASLIESELFGHEKGAFTGATARRIGRFEQAGDGTLFLDEVGELSLDAQAKLLRVLQEREFERVGGTHTIVSRARVVAATNRNLEAMVEAGQFRADLLYRLAVFPVRLPPLRERREDIPLLVRHFLGKLEPRVGRPLRGFSPQAERRLHAHGWPGNVRELENVVERAALLAEGPVLEAPALGLAFATDPDDRGRSTSRPVLALRVVDERAEILAALERSGWKVTGPKGAAAALAVHPNTLRYRMRRLGLLRPPGAQGLIRS